MTIFIANIGRKLKVYKSTIVFVLLFSVFAAFYYDSVLEKPPMFIHMWRQTDCLSLTKMYQEGASFFSPEVHYQGADDLNSGKSAGEFPLLYYLVGKLWNILGESYLVYRLFYLLILFTGQLALFKALKLLLKSDFWSVLLALLFFTSPVYAFYGVSFLTDIPAFSLSVIALYFLLRYHLEGSQKTFVWSMVFFTLAGLLKISSLIPFVFLSFILFIESLGVKTLGDRKVFTRPKLEWPGFLSVLAIVLLWYSYGSYYNSVHGFKYTFNSIFPASEYSQEFLSHLFDQISGNMIISAHNPILLYIVSAMVLANIVLFRRLNLFAYLANILVLLGALIYFLLWLPIFENHDYYYTPFFNLQFSSVLPFFFVIKGWISHKKRRSLVRILSMFFLLYSFLYCWGIMQMRRGNEVSMPFLYARSYVDYGNWLFWHSGRYLRFERIRPYLKELGIKEEDKIISMPDPSFNASLYLSGHKGWTNFWGALSVYFHGVGNSENMWQAVDHGARYLLVSEGDKLRDPFLEDFTRDKIGEFEGIQVFRLPSRKGLN